MLDNKLDAADPRSDQQPPVRRAGSRRIVAATIILAVVGLLLGNAAIVSGRKADATGNSVLHLDGGDIFVSQDGPRDAPALVLIHGLGGSIHWWDQVVPILAKSYHVIRVDPARARPVPQTGRRRLHDGTASTTGRPGTGPTRRHTRHRGRPFHRRLCRHSHH